MSEPKRDELQKMAAEFVPGHQGDTNEKIVGELAGLLVRVHNAAVETCATIPDDYTSTAATRRRIRRFKVTT